MIARPQNQAAGRPTNATPFHNGISCSVHTPSFSGYAQIFAPLGVVVGTRRRHLGPWAPRKNIRPQNRPKLLVVRLVTFRLKSSRKGS